MTTRLSVPVEGAWQYLIFHDEWRRPYVPTVTKLTQGDIGVGSRIPDSPSSYVEHSATDSERESAQPGPSKPLGAQDPNRSADSNSARLSASSVILRAIRPKIR